MLGDEMARLYERARWPWVLAGAVPALFVLFFLLLTLFADPQHDDFCFSYRYAEMGLVRSVASFYLELGGRVIPYAPIELPAVIAGATGASLLVGYAATMAMCAVFFAVGCILAVIGAWPRLRGLPSLFLGLTFAAATLGASTSVRDLLYWLPGVACYIPPAIICILILGECVRALDEQAGFSAAAILGMAVGGLVAAVCNEFTAIWLLAILGGSVLARRLLDQRPQLWAHILIAVAVLAGWSIVLMAGGNGSRMAQFDKAGLIGHSLIEALRFSMVQLGQFVREPAVIGWLIVVAAVALAIPERDAPVHPRARFLAPGVIVVCLGCCYLEYFAHQYATGIRLVERAQNQALILMLFGSGLSVSLLVRTHRRKLEQLLRSGAAFLPLTSTALPLALGIVMVASLLLSKTAFLVYAEGSSLYPYWRETVARHRLLSTSREAIVTVPRHQWTPSLLLSADAMVNTGCIARYFGKTELVIVEAPQH
jgi:hypothetical protein